MTPKQMPSGDEMRAFVLETLRGLTGAERELLADVFAEVNADAQKSRTIGLARDKQYAHRVLDDGEPVINAGDGTLAALNTTSVFDTLNPINATVTINKSNRRQADMLFSGFADCMFDYLISECWDERVAAGEATEGQVFESGTGCTFRVYSTVKGAVDHIASASNTMAHPHVTVFVCPGTYTESTITWPTSGTSTAVSITFVGSAINNENATNPGSYITSSSGHLFSIASAPIEIAAKDISFSANGGNNVFSMDSGVIRVFQAHFVNCRFAEGFDNGFTEAIFQNCYFDSSWSWAPTAAAHQAESVHFTGCFIDGPIDLSVLTSASQVRFIDNRFNGSTATITIGECNGLLVLGNTFEGISGVDRILYATNTGALNNCVIANNNFTVAPTSTNANVRIQPGAGGSVEGLVIAGNTFAQAGAGLAATTAYIKLIGTATRKILNANIYGNTFGGTDPTTFIEDRGGFSLIGDYVDYCSFGPDSPTAQTLYSLTNYTLPRVNGVLWGSGAPTHTDNFGALYSDTAADTLYIQNASPTGSDWDILGTSGGGVAAPSPHNLVSVHHDGEQDYTNTLNLLSLLVGDANFSFSLVSSNPRWTGGTNDYIEQDRATGRWRVVSNGTLVATFLDAGVTFPTTIVAMGGSGGVAGEVDFYDADGSNYVGIRAPATAQSENWVIHLPDDDPTVGQVLAAKTVSAPDVTTEWITASGGSGDVATDAIWDAIGDLVVGTGANTGARLAITVPAANILNVLGVANGETTPTWKSIFDATNPAAIGTVAPGTSLITAHRDHVHATGAGTPSTQAFGDAAAVGSGPAASMTDHKHAMPANPITAHEAAADPHTGYLKESDANYIDLTDGGATTLHSHAGGGTLDAAYDFGGAGAGRTINATDGAVLITSTDADAAYLLSVTPTPSGAAALGGIEVVVGANSTQAGISITQSGTGPGLFLADNDTIMFGTAGAVLSGAGVSATLTGSFVVSTDLSVTNGLVSFTNSDVLNGGTRILVTLTTPITITAASSTINGMILQGTMVGTGFTGLTYKGLTYAAAINGGTWSEVTALDSFVNLVLGTAIVTTYRGIRVRNPADPAATSGTVIGIDVDDFTGVNWTTKIGIRVSNPVYLQNQTELRLYDTGSSNFIGHRSNATRTTDITYEWPVTDPTAAQVLSAAAPVSNVSVLSWASAGGSVSATLVEKDLGSTPTWRGSFTITDASITAAKKVLVWQAPGPYTSKGTRADEAEMQPVSVTYVETAAGSCTVKWETPPMVAMKSQFSNHRLHAAGATFDRLVNQRLPDVEIPTRLGKVRGNVKFLYLILT